MKKYTQREWDRTVGYGEVPREYSIEIEILERENRVLRDMIYKLSYDTKERVDDFIAVAIALEKVGNENG